MKKYKDFMSIAVLIILIFFILALASEVMVWEKKVTQVAPTFTSTLTPVPQIPTTAPKFCVPRQGPCEKGEGNGTEMVWYYSEKDNLCQQFSTFIRCQGSTFATEEKCESACVVEISQRAEVRQGLYGKVYAKNCMPIGPHPKQPWHGKITFSRIEDEKIAEEIETMVDKEGNYKIGLTPGIYRVKSSQGTILPTQKQIEVQQNQWREQDFDICTSF